MQPVQGSGDHEKRRLGEILSHLVHRARYVMLGVLILIAVFLIGYFAWSEWNKKLTTSSTIAAEAVQDLFDTWTAESNGDKKAALEKDLTVRLDDLVARYSGQYGGQRGLFMRADLSFQKKEWEKAAKDYQDLARRFPQSYLAPISLFNAGVALEQKGDRDGAQALYVQVADSYKDSAVVPRATFDAARIDEEKGAFEQAQKRYESLDAGFPSSGWTKLAKNRIIALKVAGKIK